MDIASVRIRVFAMALHARVKLNWLLTYRCTLFRHQCSLFCKHNQKKNRFFHNKPAQNKLLDSQFSLQQEGILLIKIENPYLQLSFFTSGWTFEHTSYLCDLITIHLYG